MKLKYTSMAYLGFHKGGGQIFAGHSLVLTQRGPNHVFIFFLWRKNFFLPKGTMTQWPPPKYATDLFLFDDHPQNFCFALKSLLH